jgi:hypothetical protein
MPTTNDVWTAEITTARANAACLFNDAKAAVRRAARCRNARTRLDHLDDAAYELDRALLYRAEADRFEGR